jgi:pericentriolar material 1 protein
MTGFHSFRASAAASEDVTMATWGGSTAGNLESIEEGERRIMHENEEEEDDAYPSDGVVQVEEEEEANGDSDRDTYTIEDEDYSSAARRDNRHQQRCMVQPPVVEAVRARQRGPRGATLSAQSAPFQGGNSYVSAFLLLFSSPYRWLLHLQQLVN